MKKESELLNLHTVCILLALCEKAEYENVNPYFKTIYYREFLEKLKQNLGDYSTQCNFKYLSYLTDFIQFLDRKGGYMSDFTTEEKGFFLNDENNRIIDSLIARRDQFRTEQRNEKNRHVDIIKELLATKGDVDFCNFMKMDTWKGEHYLIGRFEENNPKYELGIEAGFDKKFDIHFSIWKCVDEYVERIDLYREFIELQFPDLRKTHDPSKKGDKWSVLVKSIDGNDGQIVDGLYDVYKKAIEIVNKAKEKKEANEIT